MYWYKIKHISKAAFLGGFLLLLTGLAACRPDNTPAAGQPSYFDLKTFFGGEANRLTRLNPQVNKTVTHNGVSETKTVRIDNWSRELNLFVQSDINKPAWKNSYIISKTGNTIIYTARFPELKTRYIVIKKDGGAIKWILVYNSTKNILYQTSEKLSYFPDSLYVIQKSQQVKLMGRNYYRIQGSIKFQKK